MSLTNLTVSKLFNYVDQKRVYQPQDGTSGQTQKNRALSMVLWDLHSEFQLPWNERTATLEYLDSVVDYSAPDGLDHLLAFTPDDFTERIDLKTPEEFTRLYNRNVNNIVAIDLKNRTKALKLFFDSKQKATTVTSASSSTADGTWTADTTDSDATNITSDTEVYKKFNGSVNFDVDVSQSGNNRATIYINLSTAVDLSDLEDVAHFVLDAFIPSVTNISSYDLFWGSDSASTPSTKTNYWTKNVTTQINSGALASGWNILDFDWSLATKTGSPSSATTRYIEIRVNYTSSQADDTDFRINYLRAVAPETVEYRFSTAYIAVNSAGSLIDEITDSSGTDVLMFSGMDTKFLKAVISGCVYQLAGDNNTNNGKDELKWEKRYEDDKMKLRMEYPPRILTPERRIKVYATNRQTTVRTV